MHIIQLTGVLNRFMPCGSSSRNSASAQTHMPRKVAVVVEKVGYLPWAECGVPTKQQKDVQTCSTSSLPAFPVLVSREVEQINTGQRRAGSYIENGGFISNRGSAVHFK